MDVGVVPQGRIGSRVVIAQEMEENPFAFHLDRHAGQRRPGPFVTRGPYPEAIRPRRAPRPYRGHPVDDQADDEGPRQEPILTELEAAQVYAQASRYRALEWLMAGDEPDPTALLAQLFDRPTWHARAACRGMGPDAFFPGHGGSTEAARAVCEGCAVRKDCLSAALAAGTICSGIWGGLSARGRKVLRRGAA